MILDALVKSPAIVQIEAIEELTKIEIDVKRAEEITETFVSAVEKQGEIL